MTVWLTATHTDAHTYFQVALDLDASSTSGAFGTVVMGTMDATRYAFKLLDSTKTTPKMVEAEVNALARVHHMNVVGVFGCCLDPKGSLVASCG